MLKSGYSKWSVSWSKIPKSILIFLSIKHNIVEYACLLHFPISTMHSQFKYIFITYNMLHSHLYFLICQPWLCILWKMPENTGCTGELIQTTDRKLHISSRLLYLQGFNLRFSLSLNIGRAFHVLVNYSFLSDIDCRLYMILGLQS